MRNKIIKNLNLLVVILIFVVNKYSIKYMGIENLGLMKLFTQLSGFLNLVKLVIASTHGLYSSYLIIYKIDLTLVGILTFVQNPIIR